MKRPKPQSAFSLIEVLFAVMVLTIGLIFVASQFPIGLANSRDIARASTNPINAHNTQTTLSLLISSHLAPADIGSGPTHFINSDGFVHFLIQPNYRWPTPANPTGDFVLDDVLERIIAPPFYQNFFSITPYLYAHPYHCIYDNTNTPPPIEQIPFYINLYPAAGGYTWLRSVRPLNIGQIVCPPVTGYDKDVEKTMRNLGVGFWPPSLYTLPAQFEQWDKAVFDISSKRNTSWCAFYQCMDPLPGRERTFRFFIFTIELGKNNPHFAIQGNTNPPNNFLNPIPYNDISQDRMFPVPWYVSFDLTVPKPIDPTFLYPVLDRFILENYPASPAASANILRLLRPGSVIIDANNDGNVYKITEILLLTDGTNQIRLDRNLAVYNKNGDIAYLQNFWIIPPAIVWGGGGAYAFADSQPVIDVTEKVIQF